MVRPLDRKNIKTLSTRYKILECIRQGQIGGGESHLLSLVENLDRDRFEPVVLSFTDGPMIGRLKEMGVETKVIHTERPFDFFKWNEVKRYIRSQQVDLVHAHGTRANSNVLWASRSLRLPVIYTVHGWSFHQDQPALVHRVRVMGERYLTRRSDRNISVSDSNRLSGVQQLGRFDSVVVNNGIDQVKFDPSRPFKDVRAELGIGKDELLILFIARFTSHKQPMVLLRSFARLASENTGMRLLMVGEGDQKQEALQFAAQAGLGDRVIFLPFRSDVPDVLAAADIFVLPSLWEGLPIGLLEAMAMGKAVIASNVDGSKEVVKHEVNGLLIETDGLEDHLTAALKRLAADAALRKELGARAIQTVNERFNAAVMTRSIEDIYIHTIDQKKIKK